MEQGIILCIKRQVLSQKMLLALDSLGGGDNPYKVDLLTFLRTVAVWAKRIFRLRKAPTCNTVSDILKNASTIMKPEYGEGKLRKPLKVTPALEKNLEEWVGSVAARGLCLNRKAITRKAEHIREHVGGPALDVGLSVGWLRPSRHAFGRYRVTTGSKASCDAMELAAVVFNGSQHCGALLAKDWSCDPPPWKRDEESGDEASESDGVEESDVDGDIVDLILKVASISL
ncbi:hypothetical protein ON010_g14880 [Phytophthora cinnamomi]|nr:hypothetical protein ON010_g14880 [Phytophthora cinnamomi]